MKPACLGVVAALVLTFLQAPAPAVSQGAAPSTQSASQRPVRLAVAGLVHGHVGRFLRELKGRPEVELVGIAETDAAIRQRTEQGQTAAGVPFFADVPTMLDRTKPEIVATFTSTHDHATVIEACAKRGVHVMVEKPLATSLAQARAIQGAARAGNIHVLVNYETTWYPSHNALWTIVKQQQAAGEIRKMVAMDGHRGPKEINVGPEFLTWLTDPVENGAGALFDFGCYGANLMTWLMDNQRPTAVTAITQQFKPDIYPKVDDEATILVQYPKAQGIIQGSWNWPFDRKDLDVYGARGYVSAVGGRSLRVRLPDKPEETRVPEPIASDERDVYTYIAAVVRGTLKPSGLSSLENNMIVMEILDAARDSTRTGRTVKLAEPRTNDAPRSP